MLKHYPEGMTTGPMGQLAAEAFDYAAQTPATDVVFVDGLPVTTTGAAIPRAMVEEMVADACMRLDQPALRFAA